MVLACGFCSVEQFRDHPVMKDRVTLRMEELCVLEAYRRQHIGTAMYHKILEYAKYRGCYDVTLCAWSCNESAMKFCESLGLKMQKVGMEAIV